MVICIDFDGTIVDHAFPKIGAPLPGAIETIKALKACGHTLILWTCREDHPNGKPGRMYLRDAVQFLKSHGIEFDAVNEAIPEHDLRDHGPRRKPHAQIYIDDSNFGGFPGWAAVARVMGLDFKKV